VTQILTYDRNEVVSYAEEWAFARNPEYFDFEDFGGDCTNFASQCIFAGSKVMNYTRDYGWYYVSSYDRAPSWTSVELLFRFLTRNTGSGPFATEQPLKTAALGDIIQLSFDGAAFSHSLVVVNTRPNIAVACHTMDSLGRQLSSYTYNIARLLHIEGVRG